MGKEFEELEEVPAGNIVGKKFYRSIFSIFTSLIPTVILICMRLKCGEVRVTEAYFLQNFKNV